MFNHIFRQRRIRLWRKILFNLVQSPMLPRQHRLAKTRDINNTFSRGRGFFNRFFNIKFAKSRTISRFTVVISTKVSKKATARNRMRRVIREYLHKHLAVWPSGDYVISAKPQVARIPEAAMMQELVQLLKKIVV